MERIKHFYEKLPKGPAPEPTGGGLFGWYKRRYFGKNPSPARTFFPQARYTNLAFLVLTEGLQLSYISLVSF